MAQAKAIADQDPKQAKLLLKDTLTYLRHGFDISTPQERTAIAPIVNKVMAITANIDQIDCWNSIPTEIFEQLNQELGQLIDAQR